MAVSMVSDPESEQELAESHLMLKSDCLCFRMSSSFVGNNSKRTGTSLLLQVSFRSRHCLSQFWSNALFFMQFYKMVEFKDSA